MQAAQIVKRQLVKLLVKETQNAVIRFLPKLIADFVYSSNAFPKHKMYLQAQVLYDLGNEILKNPTAIQEYKKFFERPVLFLEGRYLLLLQRECLKEKEHLKLMAHKEFERRLYSCSGALDSVLKGLATQPSSLKELLDSIYKEVSSTGLVSVNRTTLSALEVNLAEI